MPAFAWALVFAAGCAASRPDLQSLKNSGREIEPVALPSGIVRVPASRAPAQDGAADRPHQGIVLAGAEQESSRAPDGSGERDERSPLRNLESRLKVPAELPGASVGALRLPDRSTDPEGYSAAIKRLFPSLPDPPPLAEGSPDVARPKITLRELEQMALANSPIITQFESDITTQTGQAIQAGTHPNPTVGFENDTVASSQNRDYWGAYANTWIKTAGKLELAQAVQNVDIMNAQLALRQARNDVLTQVRRQYFALLIARESLVINEAVVPFTHEVYRIQVDQVTGGTAAVIEPMQLRTLAVQARGALVAARNRSTAAWRQLTATLNQNDLPLADPADEPDLAVPLIDADAAVSHVLSMNTEARIARNGPLQASLALRLAEVTPIPDIYAYATIQKDFTTPGLPHASYNAQLGVPLPLFDRNKGNILAARGTLVRATQEVPRVQNDLRGRVADAFERFETNRVLVGLFHDQILPDSIRTYRGTYERHITTPEEVGFADVVVAQQNMLNSVAAYINALTGQWTAFIDIASLLQVESLRELNLELREAAADFEAGARPKGAGAVSEAVTNMLAISKNDSPASPSRKTARRRSRALKEREAPSPSSSAEEFEPISVQDNAALMKSPDPN